MRERRLLRPDGVRLAVYEEGPAPERGGHAETVILVHGYPDTHHVWDGIAARLVDRYRVVRYDVRGAGRSTTPTDRGGFSLVHLAADLIAVADLVSPGRRVHVVGHDWGSIQTWEPITDPVQSARFASFTSISGPCIDHALHWLEDHRRDGLARDQLRRSWYILFFRVPWLAPAVWRAGFDKVFTRELARREGVPPALVSPTLQEDGARGVELYRANMQLRRPRDRSTDVPVQLVVLADDPYISPKLLDDIPRWTSNLVRRTVGGSHWTVRAHPERIAPLVAEHVERHPAT